MDIVHNIEKVEVKVADSEENADTAEDSENKEEKEKSTPVNDVIISKVTVETYGADYGKPKTLTPWNYYDWVYKTYGIDLKDIALFLPKPCPIDDLTPLRSIITFPYFV